MIAEHDQVQRIHDEGDLRKYFAQIVHMADDDLNLHEYRLYGHYMRVCGQNGGVCDETERTTAEHCGMGREKFREVRDSLIVKGYIRIIAEGTPNAPGVKGTPTVIGMCDLWAQNYVRYVKPEKIAAMRDRLAPFLKGSVEDPYQAKGSEEDPNGLGEDPYGSEEDPNGLVQTRKNKEKSEESEKEDSSTGADAAGGQNVGQEGKKELVIPYAGMTEATQDAGIGLSASDSSSPISDNALNELPLVILWRRKFNYYGPLTKTMRNHLTKDLKVRLPNGDILIKPGGLMLLSQEPGYLEHAEERMDAMMVQTARVWTAEAALAHFATKLGVGPEPGKNNWVGFLAWRDAHPELCKPAAEAAPAENAAPVIGPGMDIRELGWTEDDVIID